MNEDYNPVGNLPTPISLPYTAEGNITSQSKNYSNTPDTGMTIPELYTPTYTDKTTALVDSIRATTLNNLYSKKDTASNIANYQKDKIDISGGYVKANEAYERLSDGALLPKYEMYKPGINNEAYNASLQSNTEKILNPVQRFVTKVGRGIFADIGSFVYGVGEAAVTGRAESLFDNGMANWVDDLDKKTDFAYKNYYTEAQNGLGANLYTWDKVLGGAEFTARMLGAEAVIAVATGGASLPSSFARAGARLGLNVANDVSRLSRATRALRGIETLEDVAEIGAQASRVTRIATEPIANVARQGGGVFSAERYARGLDSAIISGKLADNLKQARFAVTGSMYEAGFEARHYQTEAENAFWEYHRSQGTEPTQEEVTNFTNKLDDTSWNVFGANMAILSVSNMALFGNMLNIKNPFPKLSTGSFFDRSVFKIGTERIAEGIWRPLKANFFNKALAYTSPIAKGAFVEGVFEEGGQGIASGMMKNYMASTYDPKAMKETADYASAFTKAFKDQYSTKEGLEEVVIGGIIGGLFGGVGGIRQTNAQYKNQEFVAQVQNAIPQVADNIVNNLYTNENLSNIFGHSNRLQGINERIEQAKAKGDVTGTALHSAESFISMLQASASVGKTDEFMTTLKESLRGMDASKIAEGQGISLESVDAFKNEKIAGVESLSENYTKAREAGGYIFGRGAIGGFYEVEGNRVNRQNLIDAFAYTSAMGAVSQQVAGDSFNTFQQKLSEIGTSREISEQFGAIGALQSAGQLELTRYRQANQEETKLKKQQQSLEEQIIRTQRSEQTPETAEKLQSLANQLTDISNQIAEASSNKELYWKSIADNFYRNLGQSEGGYLPQINFDTFNNQTGNLKEFLDKSLISEFDKLELNKLLEEFNKANSAFKSFNNLANSLSSKEFTFKTYNSIFSGKRAKADESLNELTKTTLIDLYNTNTKVGETIVQNQPTPSAVTDEVLEGISTEDYQLSENVITALADKLKNKQVLSENEQKVYDSYKTVIDEVATEEIIDPINSQSPETNVSTQTAEITVRRNEIKQLKKGIITPAVQIEIDKIDNEIKQLTEEVQRGEIDIITNLDEIVREGSGRVEVEKNGEKIPFNTFDVVIDGNEAQVGHVEIGNREDYKGIGFEAYVELGTRLSQQGITLVSSNLMQGGINLWNRLLREGFAVKEGKSFRFSPKSSTDNSAEIQILEDSKNELVLDRIEELETEISDLKAKETLDKQIAKKKKTLAGKISLLRAQILSEIAQEGGVNTEIESTLKELIKKPYYIKVRRLRKLESQLRELNNVKEDFNPDASYRDQLEWVVNNSDILEYENVETLASASPPAEEDVKRFQELDSKKRLSKTEKQELSDLKEKLLPYRLVEGSFFEGIPLIDIVDVYNQTLETENLESNQVERLPESAVQNTIKKVQTPETDPEFRAPDVGLVYDGVYIKGAVGNQSIHHIKLSTMFNLGLVQELPITVTEYTVDENGTETYAETQTVDFSNVNEMAKKYDNFQGVVINIGDDIVLEKSPKGVSFISRRADILPFLNYSAYAITGQPNAYNLIYEQKSDGTWSAKESEYEVTRDGIQVPFDKETLNSIKVGDEVTLFYDPNDDYNKTIKKKDRISQANIYVMKNGNLVNILKAVPTYREKNEGWVELTNLRKEVIENGTAKIKVKNSYVGLPNISIDENGNAVELPINESMVESYGYLGSNGEYKFFNNVIPTDTQYTDPYKEMGKNIPIIAFNYNGRVYTFPIQVNLMGANAEAELDDILNDDSLNEYQKMFKTNSLLNKYNLDKALQWTNENNSLQAIREALTDVVSKSDITDREVVQNASKTILLDMSDPFMSAKLVFDLKSASDILADTKNKDKDTRIEPITDVGTDLADENRC